MNATSTNQFYEEEEEFVQRDGRGRLRGDETLKIKFYKRAERSPLQSEVQQRPVFQDMDFVVILVPGDDKTRIDTIVTAQHKRRFPVEWQRYKDLGEVSETGTPLEESGLLPASQIMEFKHFNITTVEALANMSDEVAGKFMGGAQSLRIKAKRYLDAAAGAAGIAQAQAELAIRDEKIEKLTKMVEKLAAALPAESTPARTKTVKVE